MKKLYQNSAIYFTANIGTKAASFLLIPLYTSLVSPEQYGMLFVLQSLSAFMAAVFSLSLRASVFRFYFDNKSIHGVNKMYSSIVYFLFIFASFCYLMFFCGGKYLSTLLEIKLFPYLTIALLASYISIFYHLLISLLLAQEKAKQISVIRLSLSILTLILNIVFVLTF